MSVCMCVCVCPRTCGLYELCVCMCAHAYVGLEYGLVCVLVHACGLARGVCVCVLGVKEGEKNERID